MLERPDRRCCDAVGPIFGYVAIVRKLISLVFMNSFSLSRRRISCTKRMGPEDVGMSGSKMLEWPDRRCCNAVGPIFGSLAIVTKLI